MTIGMEKQMHDKLKRALHDTVPEETDIGRRNASDGSIGETLSDSMIADLVQTKYERRRIGFLSFSKRQIRFIRWRVWFLQGAMLFGIYRIFAFMFGSFIWENVRYMALFLCCLTVLLIMSAAPVLYRSIRYTMYEIELASRFSMVKLLLAKILAIGIGSFVWLGVVLLLTVMKSALQMESALLYIVLSYLAAGGGFLYLLGHVPAQKLLSGSVGLGGMMICVLFGLREFCPAFFAQTFSVGWGVVCAALLLFCIRQMHYFLYHSAYALVEIV